MNLQYRPEIDGFRALAVSTVVLFHAKIPGFALGFIGVDIFFVISGFLITSIIARDQANGGFSYRVFVMRRVRRIMPALVVVMLACVPFAWWLMLPDPLENFGQSLVATTLSANNILLWLTTGYWDLSSDFKPLLHTWSLGVEEQFYVLYPFLLVMALKLPRIACYGVLISMAALSFALMIRTMEADPAEAFYWLHTRAWQLLVGGIAGLLAIQARVSGNPPLAATGLGMILVALLPIGLPMIAILSLATVGAAAYLLWATEDSAAAWIFTRRPVVFVGLISYSFYLWHQPVFAFLRVALFENPDIYLFALGIGLAFGLSVLSWRFVERPFRSARQTSSRALGIFVGGSLLTSLSIGAAFHLSSGLPGRLGYPDGQGQAGVSIAYNERIHTLLPRNIPSGADKPVVMVAGNSFSRDFANVVLESGVSDRVTLMYREDLDFCSRSWSPTEIDLVARLDLLIFASGNYRSACLPDLIETVESQGTVLRFAGPKHFGENLNPLVRLTPEERAAVRLSIPTRILSINDKQIALIQERYVDLLSALSEDGRTIRVTDDDGVLLTTDRVHLSQAGAEFVARHLPQLMPELYKIAKLLANDGT